MYLGTENDGRDSRSVDLKVVPDMRRGNTINI